MLEINKRKNTTFKFIKHYIYRNSGHVTSHVTGALRPQHTVRASRGDLKLVFTCFTPGIHLK